MLFIVMFLLALAVAGLVLWLEQLGDPRLLERQYGPHPADELRRLK